MAGYKEDRFKYRKYFTGVQSFCFQKVLSEMYSAAHGSCDNVKYSDVIRFFGEKLKFLPADTGNATKIYTGALCQPKEVESYPQYEKDFYSGSDCWVNRFTAGIEGGSYSYSVSTILSGLCEIKSRAEEIRLTMADGKTNIMFDEAVLDRLMAKAKQAKDFCDGISNRKKQTAVSVLLSAMVLSYFAANGSTFLNLLENELDIPEYIGSVPLEKFRRRPICADRTEPDENLFCTTDNGSTFYSEVIKNKHLFLTADGGFGKTVQMQYAAEKLSGLGNAVVYINLKECEKLSAEQQHVFLYNRIAEFADEWSSSSPIDPHKSFCELLQAKLGDEQIFVFLDGLNEISHKTRSIILNTLTAIDTLPNLRITVSSRYTVSALESWYSLSLEKLNPYSLLNGSRLTVYENLSADRKDILSVPMFFKLFCEADDSVEPTISGLLCYKLERDIARTGTDRRALGRISDFSHYLYCRKNRIMSFGTEELYEFFGDRYKGIPFDEIVSSINIFLKNSGADSFSYEHENYRDLFVALYIAEKFRSSSDYGQTALELFAENRYSDSVLRMVSEMTDCDELLDSMRKSRFSGDWYSDAAAYSSAVVYKICSFSRKNLLLYDLNLTKTHLKYLNGCDFSGCLVSDATFIDNNIETAIFALLHDKDRKVIYAVGKHRVHTFDEQLQPKETFAFAPENHSYIACSAQNSRSIVFVNSCGEAFCFDKDTKEIFRLNDRLDKKIYSAVSPGYKGGFLLGCEDGIFVCEKDSCRYIALPENTPVFPLEKAGSAVVYCTQNRVMLYRDGCTHQLWSLDSLEVKDKKILDGQTIRKVLIIRHGNYILNFNRHGASVIAEIKLGSDYSVSGENVFFTEVEEPNTKEQLQKNLNIDYYKINDMAYISNTLFCACNSGFVRAVSRKGDGWELNDSMHFDLTKISSNPGECVESICIADNRIVFSSTTRGLYLAEFDGYWRTVKYRGGQNNGVHRIICSEDGKTLYAFLYNHGLLVLKRKNTDENFRFYRKISVSETEKQEWCWSGDITRDGVLYIASGSRLLRYQKEILDEIHDFRQKTENIIYAPDAFSKKGTDVVFVLHGHSISKVKINSRGVESLEEIKSESLKYRRTLSAAINPSNHQLYCGFSNISDQNHSSQNTCPTIGCMPQNSADCYMKSAFKNRLDGWYRSIDFIDTASGTACVCAGLQDKNGEHIAVVYDDSFNTICMLKGHSSYVMDARFTDYNSADNLLSVATCGADGKINLYSFAIGNDSTAYPVKSSCGQKGRLFNIVIDGCDLLASSLDGNIYRWKSFALTTDCTLHTEFSNSDIWITDSDFTESDTKSAFSLKDTLISLNNSF